MSAATAATTAGTRTREVLPFARGRDFERTHTSRPASSERPASIKEAVIRWLNEEL